MPDSPENHFSSDLVTVNRLSKSFSEGERDRVVLNNISMTIARGEIIALLGPSGSGKSTLLNMISAIDLPTTGDVVINGMNITRMSEQERTLFRRKNIGFIFQFFNLIPTLTVEENILLPLELTGQLNDQTRHKMQALLEEVSIWDRRASYPDRLSGGEQQRVAVARALVHGPLLLLADEPTGNLDDDTGRQVTNLLDKLAREYNMTLITVTHSRELAERADRVLILHDGRLSDSLTPAAH
jgi:putative ABC transport system ATP-binding protein